VQAEGNVPPGRVKPIPIRGKQAVMDPVEVEVVREEVDALVRALDEERWRHVAGLEPEPRLAPIFRSHSSAAHKDTLSALRERGEADLAGRVAALRAERAAAEDEERWRGAESSAAAPGPDGVLPLAEAERAVLRERDRDRRRAFGRAAAEAAAAAAPFREGAAEKRARARAESGLAPDWESVVQADDLLAASDDAWRDVLAWLARRDLGLVPRPRGDLERADLLHLLSLPGLAGHFRPGMLGIALSRSLGRLGLDLGRIRVDEADRPAQWPGAHALGLRVSFRRQGGAADWLGLFRAAGQALASEASPPSARDPAFPHALGALLEGLLLDPFFLARELSVDGRHVPDLVRALALRRLFALRARAAALRVATEVERGTSGAAWREAHRDALSAASLAAWPDGLAARDADAAAHAAALGGAAWAVRLHGRLVERLDEDWWRNPKAAAALAGVLAAGRAGPDAERPPFAEAGAALCGRLGS
jgi:hypothetical protein